MATVFEYFIPHIIVWGSYFWGCSRRRPTDRPTDRPPPRSELLLAPPLSFFYTHTRHTHVDSLTHTRQTHTRSLTVPFAHGARAGASLDTHTVDAHTFAHGARARFTLDTHLGDRATDRPPPRSELLLAPPLSFFYTHTRHTHVDSLTHTRQTHTRSLTVPFAHGARAGASLDTHTVDAHTFAHGARARFTLDTHLEPRGSFLLAGAALQALDGAQARFGAPPA